MTISTKVWDWAGIELATPGSAVRYASVARHVTDCAKRPVFRMRDSQCLIADTPEAFTIKKEGGKRDYMHDPPKKGEQVKKEALEAQGMLRI